MRPEEEIIDAKLVDAAPLDAGTKAQRRANLIEQLLSPQSLQWMMACGGGLLVIGFVIWLWSAGVFANPVLVASIVGATTLGTIVAGVAMVRATRYQLAGRGLTLMGSLALPLNLWMYDAQGLVTLADGGHLWIPAALCCLIYAAVARSLRDSNFVYALVGGVVMTGLLFLADQTVGRFWSLMPPVTFLVAIGWISSFAQQFFADTDSDFSRKNFGEAFHRAGLVVVAGGLALLLSGHLAAVASYFTTSKFWPAIVADHGQKIWALAIIAVSSIGFATLGTLHQRPAYRTISALLASWLAVATLDVFSIKITVSHLAIFAASLIAIGNGVMAWLRTTGDQRSLARFESVIGEPLDNLSLVAVGFLTVLAGGQFLAQFICPEGVAFFAPQGVLAAVQILLAGVAAWMLAWNQGDSTTGAKGPAKPQTALLGIGSLLVMLAVWSIVLFQSAFAVSTLGATAILLPIAFALASVAVPGRSRATALQTIAAVSVTAQLGLLLLVQVTSELIYGEFFEQTELMWSGSLAIASAVYLAAARSHSRSVSRVLGFVTMTLAIAVLGGYAGFEFGYCLVLAPMLVGTTIRLVDWFLENRSQTNQAIDSQVEPTQLSLAGNGLVLGAGIGGVLMAMSRWLDGDADGTVMSLMLTQLVCTSVVSVLSPSPVWRDTFRALIVATVAASVCVFDGFLNIDGWHRAELCSLLAGSFLLALSHLAWSREDGDQRDETASAGLLAGSLLVATPLTIGLLTYRLGGATDAAWMQFHEITAIAGGLILFGSGMLCKLRSTTIAGAALLSLYMVSLLTLVRWPDQLQNVSVVMMIGGGAFFATALLMSIYRDRLMSLPRRIREGEGVYRILKWR